MSTDHDIHGRNAKLLFGGIADDLTGGIELAAMLAAGGVRAEVRIGTSLPPGPVDADALVLAIQSRVLAPTEAEARFSAAVDSLQKLGARQIFQKYCATFDSKPGGNIGNCADILYQRTGSDTLLFCPAFPDVDRTVYRGHLFVANELVSNSPKRLDPLTPMTEPDLVKVLRPQTAHGVGLAPLPVVRRGSSALRSHVDDLAAGDVPMVIVDAVEEADLEVIAAASWDAPAMTGGSSVAAYYPELWMTNGLLTRSASATIIKNPGPGVVLAGSVAERTLEQIRDFSRVHPMLILDLLDPLATPELATEWAMAHCGNGPIGIATSTSHQRTQEIQRVLGVDGAARRAEMLLGEIAKSLAQRGFGRFLIAGGETSGAVVSALGIDRLKVAAFTAPGIGLCSAELPNPIALCLKSGKLGAIDMFAKVLAQMETGDG